MNTASPIRKIYQGIADRRQMFRLFDRHSQRPNSREGEAGPLFAGEWFEIGRAEHDYMFDILPPLWIRGEMFALRELLTGHITSVFYTLRLDGHFRYFHAYCDLAVARSAVALRDAIVERETRLVRAMTRDERLEHIWSATHDEYRGYAGGGLPPTQQRTIPVHGRRGGTTIKLLADLSDEEIAEKLPVHLRHLPQPIAA
jgi:hypothetical protein